VDFYVGQHNDVGSHGKGVSAVRGVSSSTPRHAVESRDPGCRDLSRAMLGSLLAPDT
jgi:hypothetical protein